MSLHMEADMVDALDGFEIQNTGEHLVGIQEDMLCFCGHLWPRNSRNLDPVFSLLLFLSPHFSGPMYKQCYSISNPTAA